MPERLGGQLDGRREARVEVEQLEVVDADAALSAATRCRVEERRARPRRWPGSARDRAGRVGNARRSASAPAQTKTARSATPARRAAASEQTTRAAPWSDPRKAVIRLVYGSQTMRLSGDGVAISSAAPRLREPGVRVGRRHLGEGGEQCAHRVPVRRRRRVRLACGDHALEQRIDVHRRQEADGRFGRSRPRAGRRRPPDRAVGRPSRVGASPAARRARDERMASAPAMRVTDSSPAAMSEAARLTSHCGVLPPTVVTSRTGGSMPRRSASSGPAQGRRGS